MPEKVDKINLIGMQDRRRKLTDNQIKEIRDKYTTGTISLNKLAKEYGVSKKLIHIKVNSEVAEANSKYIKEHWSEFYDRAKHNKAVKSLRDYKKELIQKGEL